MPKLTMDDVDKRLEEIRTRTTRPQSNIGASLTERVRGKPPLPRLPRQPRLPRV